MTSKNAELELGLAEILADSGFEAPAVMVSGVASTGATRRTVFIDIESGGSQQRAVAQISSAANVAVLPISATAEAALINLMAEAGVPVPCVLGSDDAHDAVGGSVLIAEHVDGVTIPRHVLRAVEANSPVGEHLARQCGTALAKLHSAAIDRVPDSVPRVVEPNFFSAYVPTIVQALDHLQHSQPTFRFAAAWLEQNQPISSCEPSLVHGDFRNGNIIVDRDGLAALLDWELAHVGDPMEDLAYLCMRTWRFGNHHRPVGGFGSIESLRDGYTEAGGEWRDDAFQWWMVARTAWWGIGLAFQAETFTAGISSSIVHAASGRRVVELEYDLLAML
ncbi:MAG: phosphotransferase family protein [Acidimicrobiales bacterium]